MRIPPHGWVLILFGSVLKRQRQTGDLLHLPRLLLFRAIHDRARRPGSEETESRYLQVLQVQSIEGPCVGVLAFVARSGIEWQGAVVGYTYTRTRSSLWQVFLISRCFSLLRILIKNTFTWNSNVPARYSSAYVGAFIGILGGAYSVCVNIFTLGFITQKHTTKTALKARERGNKEYKKGKMLNFPIFPELLAWEK